MSRRIVAKSCAPDVVVSEIAPRREISQQPPSAWRKAACHGLLKPPSPVVQSVACVLGDCRLARDAGELLLNQA